MSLFKVILTLSETYEAFVEAEDAEEAEEKARSLSIGSTEGFERTDIPAEYDMVAIDVDDEYTEVEENGTAEYDEERFRVLLPFDKS